MWTPTLVGARVPRARLALRIRSDCRTSRAEGGPPRTSAPTTDSGHRFRPKIPTTGFVHRFRPQIPTAVPDRPPVCCVIRPRSRNKSRPSRCVPFRSEIARRHAGGPRLSRPSPRRPRRGASARAPALTLTHVDSDVGRGARPARPSGPTHQVRLPDVPRRGRAAEDVGPYHRFRPKIPTKDFDHRFRPKIPTTDSDHRFRPQIPTTGSDHRFRPQIPATDSGQRFRPKISATDSYHRPRPPSPTAPLCAA